MIKVAHYDRGGVGGNFEGVKVLVPVSTPVSEESKGAILLLSISAWMDCALFCR